MREPAQKKSKNHSNFPRDCVYCAVVVEYKCVSLLLKPYLNVYTNDHVTDSINTYTSCKKCKLYENYVILIVKMRKLHIYT